MSVCIDLLLTGKHLQIPGHMNEYKTNQHDTRQGHEIFFAE